MNKMQLEGKWQQLMGKIQLKWGKVTNHDLDVIAGRRDLLHGKLRELYGISLEQAEKEIAELEKSGS
jgi:uncharacterized protein YjbJ (UPF0337 family)